MAADVIRRIREVTDKPIKYVVLSHYHAVRVLGASAYGASEIIASEDTRDLIVERGAADMKSEIERFPRLFQSVETIPGLTWPTMTFKGEMTVWLGKIEVRLMQLGRGHTKGDTVAWLPQQKICSAVTWSSTAPRSTPATPISATGRRRSTGSRRWAPRRSFRAAARPSPTRRCARRASPPPAPSSRTCFASVRRAWPRAMT
jgi:glyoxylase-like metal-dependent hydrolase (beta-lactamase superfamily II)